MQFTQTQWQIMAQMRRASFIIVPFIYLRATYPRPFYLSRRLQGTKINLKLLILLLLVSLCSACEQIGYYQQAVFGHLSIMSAREDINGILQKNTFNGETLDSQLAAKFHLLQEVKSFAANEMLLPADKSYNHYVDLGRDDVVYNVVAAPELSMDAYQWCYLIIGCASYRGYFSKDAAIKKSDELKALGLDVYVRGASAYSTLGYFDDPVLNTFIDNSDTHLAALIFHELAHQIIYIKDDTTFNESFAKAVEIEALRRWFMASNNEQAFAEYLTESATRKLFLSLNEELIKDFEFVYQQEIADDEKRRLKTETFARYKEKFSNLRQQNSGLDKYQAWFSGEANNAQLNSLADYYKLQNHFQYLVNQSESIEAFYKKVKALGKLDKENRQVFFEKLELSFIDD